MSKKKMFEFWEVLCFMFDVKYPINRPTRRRFPRSWSFSTTGKSLVLAQSLRLLSFLCANSMKSTAKFLPTPESYLVQILYPCQRSSNPTVRRSWLIGNWSLLKPALRTVVYCKIIELSIQATVADWKKKYSMMGAKTTLRSSGGWI